MSIQTFTAYVAGLTNATSVVGADEPVINQSGTVKAVTNTVHRAYLDGYYGVQGRKIGLKISYVSSDVLTVGIGACEVNDGTDSWWVEKAAATAINSGTANFPSAAAWAFVAIKADGTIALYAATGTAAQRPTNNLFQLAGGSVGYDDIGKHGYYYDADERVIGAIHKVSATSWYIINLGDGDSEEGQNINGNWTYINRKLKQRGLTAEATVALTTAWFAGYKGTGQVVFPRSFSADLGYVFNASVQYAGANKDLHIGCLDADTYHLVNKIDFRVIGDAASETLSLRFEWTAEEI
jgi:hypothetical protein